METLFCANAYVTILTRVYNHVAYIDINYGTHSEYAPSVKSSCSEHEAFMYWMAVDKAVLVIAALVKNFTLTFRKCFDKRASET